nr:uncharacterized protein LOC110129609 isoform X2 [Odocoileus virginianus texanus]
MNLLPAAAQQALSSSRKVWQTHFRTFVPLSLALPTPAALLQTVESLQSKISRVFGADLFPPPAEGVTSAAPPPDLSASEERMHLPLLSAGSTREPSREPAPGVRGQQTKAETSLGAETSLAPGPASPAQKKGPCRNVSSQGAASGDWVPGSQRRGQHLLPRLDSGRAPRAAGLQAKLVVSWGR